MYSDAIGLAVAASAAWAVGMTAATPALRYVDRLTYLISRWGLVAGLALVYAVCTGHLAMPSIEAALWAVVVGLVDATAGGFFYLLALERGATYQVTAIANTAPLWGVLGAVLCLGEPLRWSVAVAAGLAVLGTWFLVEPHADSAGSPARGMAAGGRATGALLALLTGVLWGVAETVPAKLALEHGLSPETMLFVFALAGCVGAILLVPFLRRRIPVRAEPRGFLYVALSGVAGAGVGWLLWLFSLERAPASVVAPVRGMTLVFCLIFSVAFLRERPTARALLGIALAIGAVLVVSFGI
jgi:drug/metabolite transporter (DMT)-like permease